MALVSRAVAVCVLLLAASAPPVGAATWRKVTGAFNPAADGGGGAVVSLARNGGVLNVLWAQQKSVLNSQVSANGKTITGPHTVYVYTDLAGDGPALLAGPGGLGALFTGIDAGTPLNGLVAAAASADGISWGAPVAASNSSFGGRLRPRAPLGGTLLSDGTPLSIWGGFNDEAGYHVGTNEADPNVRFFDGDGSRCCIAEPNAATDAASGAVIIGYSDADGRQLVKPVLATAGFPPGPAMSIPGAEAVESGPTPLGMTGRSGGASGIFVAYLRGTNVFLSSPTVWRVGDFRPIRLARRGLFPGVAMGTDGRIWAYWADGLSTGQTRRIFAARSNEQATRFGRTVPVPPPRGTNGNGNIRNLEGEGTAPGGALDLVASLIGPAGGAGNYVTRVLPGITVRVKRLGDGAVRITTLDAGERLPTKVRLAGKTKRTGRDGRVVITLKQPGDRPRSRESLRVTSNGYHPATQKAIIIYF